MGFDVFPLWLIVAFVVLACLGAYLSWRREQDRMRARHALAAQRGWRFTARDDGWHTRFGATFAILRSGDRGRQSRNIMEISGLRHRHVLFDFRYQVTSGSSKNRSTRTYWLGIAVAHLDGWLPELELSGETFMTRISRALGFGDIELESDAFNRRFRVRAADRVHAYDVLHPRAMEFLLSQRFDEWHLANGMLLLAVDRRWEPDDYDTIPAKSEAFIALIPDYVWDKYGAGRQGA